MVAQLEYPNSLEEIIMFRVVLPDGTFIEASSKAELYRLIAEAKENYEGYLS